MGYHPQPSYSLKRVAAIFVFVSFTSLLSITGIPAHIKEIKMYLSEKSNQHSGALVFLLGQLFSSIPFLFLTSISSSLVFYFLTGLRNEFSLLMYFMLNVFMCLLANEGLLLVVASLWKDVFSGILTLLILHAIMMLSAGYFRIRNDLPRPVWVYPLSYISFHTYSIKGLLENEYIGTYFPAGLRAIPGAEALHSEYDISPHSNSKWNKLFVLFLMAVVYRSLAFFLLQFQFHVRQSLSMLKTFSCKQANDKK